MSSSQPSDVLLALLQNRGFSYRKMERYEEAIRDYSMAVQVGVLCSCLVSYPSLR